ncbi:hypothetical protein KAR28_05355 [Candidatus Parcubacteria bacterium]|nr:hypothetical protein [Candidatus Parcubacteria bacterium]
MIKFSISKEPVEHNEDGCPWYDTKEGIEKSLTSLAGLNHLIRARRVAGYQRDERMNEFFIFGRFSLDTCGNCSKAHGYVPKDEMPEIPDVMTRDDFWAYIKEHSKRGEKTMVSFAMGSEIPDDNILCPYCGKSWEANNCHNTVPIRSTEVYLLDEFVGKTLGEVKAAYAAKTDATYFMQSDILVRNDKNINLSLRYPDSEKDWERRIVVNEHGWLSERESVTDEYVVQEDDEGYFNVWKYFHSDCHLKSVADDPEFLGKDGHFKNLAGAAYADVVIKKELKDAGIEIVKGNRTNSEVPFTLSGKLGTFKLVRAWTYWMIDCIMPLEAAKEMYENEVGAKFVRVAGHCGCPPPEEWALPCADDLKKGLDNLGVESATYGELADILNSGKIDAPRFVQSYHIDTMPGLKLFVETARKHALA